MIKMIRTIRLQGIGLVTSLPAAELQVGMRLMWNGGSTYDVVSIRDKSPKFIEIVEKCTQSGKEYTRRLKKDRHVAGYWPKR